MVVKPSQFNLLETFTLLLDRIICIKIIKLEFLRRRYYTMADKTLTCKDCGAEFVFTEGEQAFMQKRI